ncbi:MAG: polysaccharide deacetylase family protein [Deltaproteobacteria bacterium]|nr:polysaccharide deacetylase family protein [Deltaproteobacteria bacterium]
MNWVKAAFVRASLRVLFFVGCGLLLSACASLSGFFETQEDIPDVRPLVFQSEDLVVYRVRAGETAEGLAERFLKDKSRAWIIEEENEGVPFEEGNFIVIPLTEKRTGGLAPEGYQTVPILCYHRLAERCESALCMTKLLFEEQMRYLKENDYRVISMVELQDFLAYRRRIPRKAVVINLDDGYRSAYEIAYPILKKYNYKACLFIYTDFIGASSNSLTWEQLREMKEDGFEVGSHSLSHCDLTKKKQGEDDHRYIKRIREELIRSKEIIDRKLNQDTTYFAFPYGDYNQLVLSLCEEAGYKTALSVNRGGNPFFSDPLALRRDQILRKDMESFIDTLNTFFDLSLR